MRFYIIAAYSCHFILNKSLSYLSCSFITYLTSLWSSFIFLSFSFLFRCFAATSLLFLHCLSLFKRSGWSSYKLFILYHSGDIYLLLLMKATYISYVYNVYGRNIIPILYFWLYGETPVVYCLYIHCIRYLIYADRNILPVRNIAYLLRGHTIIFGMIYRRYHIGIYFLIIIYDYTLHLNCRWHIINAARQRNVYNYKHNAGVCRYI